MLTFYSNRVAMRSARPHNKTRYNALRQWKKRLDAGNGALTPALAPVQTHDDDVSVMLRLWGEDAASTVIAYWEARNQLSLISISYGQLAKLHTETTTTLRESASYLEALDGRLSHTSSSVRADIDQRQAMIAVLRKVEHKHAIAAISFQSLAHTYRIIVEHTILDQGILGPGLLAVSAGCLKLRLMCNRLTRGMAKIRRECAAHLQQQTTSRSPGRASALADVYRVIDQSLLAMNLVKGCLLEVAATLKTVSFLAGGMNGTIIAHMKQSTFSLDSHSRGLINIKTWAKRKSRLAHPRTPDSGWRAFANIEERADTLMTKGIAEALRCKLEVQRILMLSAKAQLEGPSASTVAARIQRGVVDTILSFYVRSVDTEGFRTLCKWGYQPSGFLKDRLNISRYQSTAPRFMPVVSRRPPSLGRVSLPVFPRVVQRIDAQKRNVIARASLPDNRLQATRTPYNRQLYMTRRRQRRLEHLVRHGRASPDQRGLATSSSGHQVLTRSTSGTKSEILGLGRSHTVPLVTIPDFQIKKRRMIQKDNSKDTQITTTASPKSLITSNATNQASRSPTARPFDQSLTAPHAQTARVAKDPTRGLHFKSSPRMLAPKSSFWAGIATLQENLSEPRGSVNGDPIQSPGGVNGDAGKPLESVNGDSRESSGGVKGDANDSGSGEIRGQGYAEPHNSDHEGRGTSPPTPTCKENPDPDRPSDSEHDSSSESDSESESESESNMDDGTKANTHVPLSFQIPSDKLLAAMQASPNTRASYWSQQLYRGPNKETVAVHYCRNLEVAERVAKHFLNEQVVGFDLEWKPFGWPTSIKQNASLIQLACENRIALFHVALFAGTTPAQLMPPSLKVILESPDIYKVGVNIKGDFTRLEKHLGIRARGVVELSRLHNLVERPEANHRLCKLATQVQQHLLLPLYKGEPLAEDVAPNPEESAAGNDVDVNTDDNDAKAKAGDGAGKDPEINTTDASPKARTKGSVRESDWSQRLDLDQIHYAAADAYAGFRIYDVLEFKRRKMKPVPPQPRLCDDDPVGRPASQKKPRVKKKPKSEITEVVNEALGTVSREEDSEDDQEYETAPEGLEEGLQEEDDVEESSSDSSSEVSHLRDDASGADFIASRPFQPILSGTVKVAAADGSAPSRRVGRVKYTSLADVDPGYPVLPTAPPVDEDSESDMSEAFDPAPKARPRRGVAAPSAAKNFEAQEDSEFADSDLEDALMDMDMDQLEEALEKKGIEDRGRVSINCTAGPAFSSLLPGNEDTSDTSAELASAQWARKYLQDTVPALSSPSSRPAGIRATVPHLRAYYLWHHRRLSPTEISACLKEPPLAHSTVSSYILQAVSLEKLECDEPRLIEMLETIPQSTRIARWGSLCKRVWGSGVNNHARIP
jgi:hypothetical protein